jgi:hypothetical protein
MTAKTELPRLLALIQNQIYKSSLKGRIGIRFGMKRTTPELEDIRMKSQA